MIPFRFIPFAAAACLCSATTLLAAELKLAAPFESHMVLQRDKNIPVWGVADAGAEVSVSFAGQKKTTRAGASGKWTLALSPLVASSESRDFAVTATPPAGKTTPDGKPDTPATVVLKDVLVGEVWVCSGQSNMEQGITFPNTLNGHKEAAAANYPLIRLKFSRKVAAETPQTAWHGSAWRVCSPDNIRRGTWNGFSAAAFFFGRDLHKELKVPVGIIQVAWGGTRVEPWTPPAGFASVPKFAQLAKLRPKNVGKGHPSQPTALYNSMIHPLVPYAIRGAIWYQGEANLGETDYAQKMAALVQGWRAVWKQGDFPFYFAQLAPFVYRASPYQLPITMEQQTIFTTEVPNTGMAIINDVGNLRDIHPGDKQTVGARLARLALSRIHGKKYADDCGPLFKTARITGPHTIVVEFDNTNSGLTTRNGKAPDYFELAGKDDIFHPATAKIVGKTVEVTCEELAAVKQVRFAWRHDAEPNLANGEKLPAGAFRWKAK
ncbi:MAG: hypothetical protein LBT53_02365 [Puniceicoccales bacterium]|jgi:sialate O-acetylesterase|nr:hypothetical protein [Puniceicoccales bacterium]